MNRKGRIKPIVKILVISIIIIFLSSFTSLWAMLIENAGGLYLNEDGFNGSFSNKMIPPNLSSSDGPDLEPPSVFNTPAEAIKDFVKKLHSNWECLELRKTSGAYYDSSKNLLHEVYCKNDGLIEDYILDVDKINGIYEARKDGEKKVYQFIPDDDIGQEGSWVEVKSENPVIVQSLAKNSPKAILTEGQKKIYELVTQLMNAEFLDYKLLVAEKLVEIGESALPFLKKLAKSKDDLIRKVAQISWVEIEGSKAIDEIVNSSEYGINESQKDTLLKMLEEKAVPASAIKLILLGAIKYDVGNFKHPRILHEWPYSEGRLDYISFVDPDFGISLDSYKMKSRGFYACNAIIIHDPELGITAFAHSQPYESSEAVNAYLKNIFGKLGDLGVKVDRLEIKIIYGPYSENDIELKENIQRALQRLGCDKDKIRTYQWKNNPDVYGGIDEITVVNGKITAREGDIIKTDEEMFPLR